MEQRDPRHIEDVDALGWPQDSFSRDLGHGRSGDTTAAGPGAGETRVPTHHEPLPSELGELAERDREALTIVREGASLDQGSVYVDLNDLAAGPFVALGGQVAGPDNRYVPKRDVDYETWNRLVGQDAEPETVRPSDVEDDDRQG